MRRPASTKTITRESFAVTKPYFLFVFFLRVERLTRFKRNSRPRYCVRTGTIPFHCVRFLNFYTAVN